MWDDLPTEISTNILHRLPVKTLIKCTILSKSFLSLITSRPFISDHITQHADSHLLLRYFTCDNQEKYHFESDDHNFNGFQTDGLFVPFYNLKECFTVAGCVNGVICLVNDLSGEGTLIILWNPSIRKFVHVPEPIMYFETCGAYKSVCGFGFDPISDDYKVVRLVHLEADFEARSETQVEVYSLKSGCWRVIGVGPCYSIKEYCHVYTPRYINGSVYWVAPRYGPIYEYVLLRFDMSTEIFETIQLPEVLKLRESSYTRDLYVQASKGILTLIKSNNNYESRTCSALSAWILKEDGVVKSWTKIFDFDFSKLHPHGMPNAFSFRKNGEVILVKCGRDDYGRFRYAVVSIDSVTQSETTLRDANREYPSFYLSTYVESMVLFKEGKGIEELNTPLNFFPMKR